jgi:hypothetical protein
MHEPSRKHARKLFVAPRELFEPGASDAVADGHGCSQTDR